MSVAPRALAFSRRLAVGAVSSVRALSPVYHPDRLPLAPRHRTRRAELDVGCEGERRRELGAKPDGEPAHILRVGGRA